MTTEEVNLFEINPCILCGNTKPTLVCWDGIDDYQIVCNINGLTRCTFRSNLYKDEDEATIGWNKVDKFGGEWDLNVVPNEDSQKYIEMILKIKQDAK